MIRVYDDQTERLIGEYPQSDWEVLPVPTSRMLWKYLTPVVGAICALLMGGLVSTALRFGVGLSWLTTVLIGLACAGVILALVTQNIPAKHLGLFQIFGDTPSGFYTPDGWQCQLPGIFTLKVEDGRSKPLHLFMTQVKAGDGLFVKVDGILRVRITDPRRFQAVEDPFGEEVAGPQGETINTGGHLPATTMAAIRRYCSAYPSINIPRNIRDRMNGNGSSIPVLKRHRANCSGRGECACPELVALVDQNLEIGQRITAEMNANTAGWGFTVEFEVTEIIPPDEVISEIASLQAELIQSAKLQEESLRVEKIARTYHPEGPDGSQAWISALRLAVMQTGGAEGLVLDGGEVGDFATGEAARRAQRRPRGGQS